MMSLKQLKLLTKIHLTGKFYLTSRKYVQLAGRPFLLGSQGKGFPSFLNGQKESYPFTFMRVKIVLKILQLQKIVHIY